MHGRTTIKVGSTTYQGHILRAVAVGVAVVVAVRVVVLEVIKARGDVE